MFWYKFNFQVDLSRGHSPMDTYSNRVASKKVSLNISRDIKHFCQWMHYHMTNDNSELA